MRKSVGKGATIFTTGRKNKMFSAAHCVCVNLILCNNNVLQISIKLSFYVVPLVARLANLERKCVENEKRPNISYRLQS